MINYGPNIHGEVSLPTIKISFSDLESDYSDPVTMGSSSSENSYQRKDNLTSDKFSDIIKDETVTNPSFTFDTKTTRTTLVPVHYNTNYLHGTTIPVEVSRTTSKIAFSELQFDGSDEASDVVTDGSSENNVHIKFNESSSPTCDKEDDDTVTNSTFDTETMNKTRVQVHTTAPHNEILSENQMLVELTTPGTLSTVEVHRVDVSKPESSPEAIPDIEDDDRNMTEIPSEFLSTQASPLPNYVFTIQKIYKMTPQSQQKNIEYATQFTNDEDLANNLLTLGIEEEESKELETMYYSDIYAISTIQPVHEVTFYATIAEDITESDRFVKQEVEDFNLPKEEMGMSTTKTVTNSEWYELVTVVPRYDLDDYIVSGNEDYESITQEWPNQDYLIDNIE